MLVVVDANAVVDPWAMAGTLSAQTDSFRGSLSLLVLPRHTPPAPSTMLTPQRLPDHTNRTEMGLIERIMLDQLIDRLFRLAPRITLWNESRIGRHRHGVKVSTHYVCNSKEQVEERSGRICPRQDVEDVPDAYPKECSSKDAG